MSDPRGFPGRRPRPNRIITPWMIGLVAPRDRATTKAARIAGNGLNHGFGDHATAPLISKAHADADSRSLNRHRPHSL